jgi:toluene monooxygenase system protein A
VQDRDEWLDLARKLDWDFSYVDEREAFPEALSGRPWLPGETWRGWDEPYRTSYAEYVENQHAKELSIAAVREAVGTAEDLSRLDKGWLSAVKLHAATLPLAEFAAVVGNLRAARFGRDSAWRTTAAMGALDELRHTQLPLLAFHDLVQWDPQFDWTHKLLHTNQWVGVAARHFVDELLLGSDPIELAIGTNFVFETGFTNLQFVGLSSMAHRVGDRFFEKLVQSIQTDEARHAQIGHPVLEKVLEHDPKYAQYLVDKWFWRSWQLFAVITGFAMDYLTPLQHRAASFKEFVHEWIVEQFERSLRALGLKRPWYWEQFLSATDYYHHMLYASAYSYRATVWFDFVLPGPDERAWLREKYPLSWADLDPIWEQLTERWRSAGPNVEWHTHGATPVAFCALCQLVLCGGTPRANTARTVTHEGHKLVFCSEPCEWIFRSDLGRYANHVDVAHRILAGNAPANVIQLVTEYFGLTQETWGKDAHGGSYAWLTK